MIDGSVTLIFYKSHDKYGGESEKDHRREYDDAAVAGLNRAAAGRRRAVGVRCGIAGGGFLRSRGRVGA